MMNKNIGDMTTSELKDYIIELQEENSRYERKIDKAIEYIKRKMKILTAEEGGGLGLQNYDVRDLLEILGDK